MVPIRLSWSWTELHLRQGFENSPANHVGGCQNDAPLLGPLKILVPYSTKDPKKDHNFDNYPCMSAAWSEPLSRLRIVVGLCSGRTHGSAMILFLLYRAH